MAIFNEFGFMKQFYILCIFLSALVVEVFSQSMTISGGNTHGVVICSEGFLYGWGLNNSSTQKGLLGLDPEDPTYTTADKVFSPSRVKTDNLKFSQVTAGSGASALALSCKSVVYAWGDNENRQCGQGSLAANVIEKPMPVLKGQTKGYTEDGEEGGDYLGGVVFVSASTAASFALMDDGRVVGWGGAMNFSAAWTQSVCELPTYIKDYKGNDLKNVIHIAAGDDNCYFLVDEDGDGMGMVYSIGGINGRGDSGDGTEEAPAEYAAPLTVAAPVLDAETMLPIDNIKMSAAADVAGFAVDGKTGYVYSWGKAWGGVTGHANGDKATAFAEKVVSGDYKAKSGEEYLTDVKEVIGGKGYGAAVTKEGYLLYWGCANENSNVEGDSYYNGGVIANDFEGVSTSKTGPQFLIYCDGDTVTDAVKIARGDNFGFMVNAKDEYYAWGVNQYGQCGVGKEDKVFKCLTKMEIPCETQDACPEAFMVDELFLCRGKSLTLSSGFTVPIGKEDRYFFSWSRNGKLLNTTTKNSSKAERAADVFNKTEIEVAEDGEYSVEIEYISGNVPCNSCEVVKESVVVKFKDMPVDTLQPLSCVASPMSPVAADQVCFGFKSKYAKDSEFLVFASEEGGTALDTIRCSADSPAASFCVTGNNVTAEKVKSDTLYTIWIEDATKERGSVMEGFTEGSEVCNQFVTAQFIAFEDLVIDSVDVHLGTHYGEKENVVYAVVYGAAKNAQGQYVADLDNVIAKGEPVSVVVPQAGEIFSIPVNIKLDGHTRGTMYFFGVETEGEAYLKMMSSANSYPFEDNLTGGVLVVKQAFQGDQEYSGFGPFGNIAFSKLTSYDCGRIALTSKYWCPPCKKPDANTNGDYFKIKSSQSVKEDTVHLCRESEAVTFMVSLQTSDADAKFDVLWFDDAKMVDEYALKEDLNTMLSSYKIAWKDIPEGATKTVYVKVRDNEDPTSAGCWIYDSIKIKANKVPLVPDIEVLPFCEGSLLAADIEGIQNKFKTDTLSVAAYLNGAEFDWSALNLLADGDVSLRILPQDLRTGCVGDSSDFLFTVNALPDAPEAPGLDLLKENAFQYIDGAAVALSGHKVLWYKDAVGGIGSEEAFEQDRSVADSFFYWASQINETTKCESERVRVVVTVNDAPKPEVRDSSVCNGDEIDDLASLVTKKSDIYELYWYDSKTAEKGSGSKVPPVFDGTKLGKNVFYVSQKNTETGAESEKQELVVYVYDVKKPSVEDLRYCADEESPELAAVSVVDEENYYYANGFVWYSEGIQENSVPKVSTNVGQTEVFNYSVGQSFTMDNKRVCYGDTVSFTVTVTKMLPPTGNFDVDYIKSEGADNGGVFADLLKQNPDVANPTESNVLVWYDENKNIIGDGTKAPCPPYNADVPVGVDEVFRYYVSQKNEDGCESVLKEVVATVSSTPRPKVEPVFYCENAEAKPLVASINFVEPYEESDYKLIWYSKNPAEGGAEIVDEIVPATDLSDPNLVEETKSYYVAQYNVNDEDNVSAPSEIKVTVYAKPRLKTDRPAPVCEGTINLVEQWYVSNKVFMKVEAEYVENGGNEVVNEKAVGESGEYSVRGYFPVNDEECSSDFEKIVVQIDTLDGVTVDGVATACPNSIVELSGKTAYSTNNVDYYWADANGDTIKSLTFVSPELGSTVGEEYHFTMLARSGSCRDSVDHKVVIGDGAVDGVLVFKEEGNTESPKRFTASSNSIKFYSCGNEVEVDASEVINTNEIDGDAFRWYDRNGKLIGSGKQMVMNLQRGTHAFRLSYSNKCKTSIDFSFVSDPLKVVQSDQPMSICEGDTFKSELEIVCDAEPVVEWYKNDAKLAISSNKIEFDNVDKTVGGIYRYKVFTRGCVVESQLGNEPLTVRPYIKFAAEKNEYVARYDSLLAIKLTMKEPESLPAEIAWIENNKTISRSKDISFNVRRDRNLYVEMSDPEYCSASESISVKVDARLALNTVILDSNKGIAKDKICYGDNAVLVIDTAGTGRFVFADKVRLKVTELTDVDSKILYDWHLKDGKLNLAISPKSDAEYIVEFVYREGEGVDEQRIVRREKLTVAPPVLIDLPVGMRACEGDIVEISAMNVSPADAKLSWKPDASIVSGLTNSKSIKVEAVYEKSESHSFTKTYTLVASYADCQDREFVVNLKVDEALKGRIEGADRICEGSMAELDASSFDAVRYVWYSESFEGEKQSAKISISSEYDTYYQLFMERGLCSMVLDHFVEVTTVPHIEKVDSVNYQDVEVVLASSLGTPPFCIWIDDKQQVGQNPLKEKVGYGKHTAYVVDDVGCSDKYEFEVKAPALSIPVAVSPNGDGINETFEIPAISEAYPDAKIKIYDRFGKKLAEYRGDAGAWDGTYNGMPMPSTDYWYEIEIKELSKTYTGHFTLIRQ